MSRHYNDLRYHPILTRLKFLYDHIKRKIRERKVNNVNKLRQDIIDEWNQLPVRFQHRPVGLMARWWTEIILVITPGANLTYLAHPPPPPGQFFMGAKVFIWMQKIVSPKNIGLGYVKMHGFHGNLSALHKYGVYLELGHISRAIYPRPLNVVPH